MSYKKFARSHIFNFFILALMALSACSVDSNSDLLTKMQMTMATADGNWEIKNQRVSALIEKTFPKRSNLETALLALSKEGFKVTEYKSDGWRIWPKGNIKKYPPEHRSQKNFPGEIIYSAEKRYGLPLNRYGAVVSIRTDGKIITEISGGIYPYHL